MGCGIVGIYLAAGASRRMGQEKLALEMGAESLGGVALRAALASKLERVFVVTREDGVPRWLLPFLTEEAFWRKGRLLACAEAVQGQAYSLRYGVRAAQELGADAAMVLLADQPFVTVGMMNEIVEQYARNRQDHVCTQAGYGSEDTWQKKVEMPLDYVAASYQGVMRPPILFARKMFGALLRLEGDEGARRILREGSWEGKRIEFVEEKAFWDVDTREDYEKVRNEWSP